MRVPFKKVFGFLLLFLVLDSLGLQCFSVLTGHTENTADKEINVYVAFGFHVNLYHSFRGDTNDDSGFGKDIVNIRHILDTLDRANDRGIPVRASWDFDNHFSLEQLLPQYAPDIIDRVRQRVAAGRDEVLLMSYNNGLASAMNRRELTDAVSWAVTNPWGSGVKDLFGQYSPIVRPQEMMTTPGNFRIYKEQGVKALALYYSAVPFDAFRVFTRPLTMMEAYNPLTYRNNRTKEEMLVIPTYNIGDLVENVSLRNWVRDLRDDQKQGKISRDVLVFINFDADSDFWKGVGDRWPLNQFPNTGGLGKLIDEVQDLEYVRFTTLKDYLAGHGPAGEITFQQDTADGSFDGYNSWAEKKTTTDYWTRIMASRRTHQTVETLAGNLDDPGLRAGLAPVMTSAYINRLKALSTTHFGMATPFVAPQRETAMAAILDDLDRSNDRMKQAMEIRARQVLAPFSPETVRRQGLTWIDTLMVMAPGRTPGVRFISLALPDRLPGGHGYFLAGRDMAPVSLIPLARLDGKVKFYISGDRPLPDGVYFLCRGPLPAQAVSGPASDISADGTVLANPGLSVVFTGSGRLQTLKWNDESVLDTGSLAPYFRHDGRVYAPTHLVFTPADTGHPQSAVLEVKGTWDGPDGLSLSGGSVDYRFTLVKDLPYLFVDGQVVYPGTRYRDVLKADITGLAKQLDLGWQEAVPAELRFLPRADRTRPVRILKRNFMGVETCYDLDYYRHSTHNLNLDNVNNHITDGYMAVVSGGKGMAVGMDTTVAANFAFAPVKIRYDKQNDSFSARVNPFGTYHGRQYRHPTWGNRQGFKATVLSGEQFHSSAPTFNGQTVRFSLMLTFFDGDEIPGPMRRDLLMHASPGVVFSLRQWPEVQEPAPDPAPLLTARASLTNGETAFTYHPAEPSIPPHLYLEFMWTNFKAAMGL